MIVVGIAGCDWGSREQVALAVTRGRLGIEWRFLDSVLDVVGKLYRLHYEQLATPEGRAGVDLYWGKSGLELMEDARRMIPDAQWRKSAEKRLVGCLPTNVVVFSDVVEEWQADLIRDCGGLVVHVAMPGAVDSSVVVGSSDVVFVPEDGLLLEESVNQRYFAWEAACSPFALRDGVKGHCGNSGLSC